MLPRQSCWHGRLFPIHAGGCVKYTNKWAEEVVEGGKKREWGDKWEERFKDGKGGKKVSLEGSGRGESRGVGGTAPLPTHAAHRRVAAGTVCAGAKRPGPSSHAVAPARPPACAVAGHAARPRPHRLAMGSCPTCAVPQGETWSVSPEGERFNRWWSEDHAGDGGVRKRGHSTAGEHWDVAEQMDTYYNPIPHFGYDLALAHSPQLRSVPVLPWTDNEDLEQGGGLDDVLG